MDRTTRADSRLLRNEAVLTAAYEPDKLVGREDLRARIETAITPLTANDPPEHVYLYGPTGIGKTSVVRHVLAEADQTTRLNTALINCVRYNTRPALLAQLLIELGYPMPRKGKAVDTLLGKLQEWLGKHHGAVIALDEVDQLADVSETIYDLHETAAAVATPVPVSLLCLSTAPPTALNLDRRSLSRVPLSLIEVPPYSAEELTAILDERVEQAFTDPETTVPDELLSIIADRVASRSGDCRHALALLHRTARIAEQDGGDGLSVEHLPDQMSAAEFEQMG
jgi:cell division control protein 6